MKSIKNDKGKGKGKTFAPFAPFARLMTRRLTAAFSAALLTTAMLTTALFFASCGDSGASEDMAAPTNLPSTASSKLSITPASQHLIPGDSVKFTVKMIVGSENKDVTKDASLIIAGSHDNDTKISNGTLTVSNNEAAGRLSISGTYKDANVTVFVEVIDPSKKSIKEKFGITTEKTDAVSDTFTALHKFIQADGLVKLPEVIKPGDWIELEGGLTVAEYGDGEGKAGGFSYSYNDESWNKEIMITLNKGEWTESVSRGKLNRLIVVGINSFQTGKGYPVGSYTYPAGGDTPPPH
ncbi:MAG: hypothetical protein LBK66_11930, partial [Spirochaetaceae bacterium]|nr:hypothetical protein [Spirochaetaceae bacterium]